MMKTLTLYSLLVLLLLGQTVTAQNIEESDKRSRTQSFYMEFLGSAAVYSLNYDRLISEHFGFRVGLGFLDGIYGERIDFIGVPVLLNYLIKVSDSHNLELGLGISMLKFRKFTENPDEVDEFRIAETMSIGYRYQPRNKSFIFRITFTPFFKPFINPDEEVQDAIPFFGPWGGLSVGITF
ncbi:MAG: hypothetical protein GWN00_33325 [Aliifodinibius sp.]|nr:hypothetical protein [Fodinibius sp.]NIY29497.1 hypothetical protein [Fodinibius sp.]